MQINPYLFFDSNCEAAFKFYGAAEEERPFGDLAVLGLSRGRLCETEKAGNGYQ